MSAASAKRWRRVHSAASRKVVETRLREAISRGDMAPGHRLVESDLMAQFGMTRNGVRLALDALAADGLVERVPNKGARVRLVTTDEAVGIMECRMVLDGLLSRRAAESATDAQVERLLANRERMRAAVASGDLATYSDLIQAHHAIVQDMARRPVAADLVARLQGQIVRHQFRLSRHPERAPESLQELELVVDAVADRDPDRAEAAARAHLQGVIDSVLSEPVRA
ncbi:GntR family transcriptional regulator [Geodermatophilus sp. CPCC 206100]|uniref:GntR family transcriptional regulator n=1 Tax=Geodermatophilus sp. CPCC 206100 TaxID=3020054 RepID=UPI003AFF97B7